jgi:hypothetical protein
MATQGNRYSHCSCATRSLWPLLQAATAYSMANIWGVNATCINHDTRLAYPASCPHDSSWCDCPDAPYPEAQIFVSDLESSLQFQGQEEGKGWA